MRILAACLLVGACSSAPPRSGQSAPDGGSVTVPDVDAAPGSPIVDPPPGTPAPRLLGAPLEIDFGTVNIGATRTGAVVITNIGDAPTRPLEAMLSPVPDLRLTTNCRNRPLRPEETCVVTAEFEPRAAGASVAMGSIDDGPDGLRPITFTARGTGRVGPDAGPDLARPMADASGDGMAAPRDLAAPAPDLARDVGADLAAPRDTVPDLQAPDARD